MWDAEGLTSNVISAYFLIYFYVCAWLWLMNNLKHG